MGSRYEKGGGRGEGEMDEKTDQDQLTKKERTKALADSAKTNRKSEEETESQH